MFFNKKKEQEQKEKIKKMEEKIKMLESLKKEKEVTSISKSLEDILKIASMNMFLETNKVDVIDIISFYGCIKEDRYENEEQLPTLKHSVYINCYYENKQIKSWEIPVSEPIGDGCIYSKYACNRRYTEYTLTKFIGQFIKDNIELKLSRKNSSPKINLIENKEEGLLFYKDTNL